MGREEGSPIFAESVAYDGRRTRGRKKLLAAAVTVGLTIILTVAIAVPLSSEKNNPQLNSVETKTLGSSGPVLQSAHLQSFNSDDEHYYVDETDERNIDAQLQRSHDSHRHQWRPQTRRPWTPHPKDYTRRTWWPRTTRPTVTKSTNNSTNVTTAKSSVRPLNPDDDCNSHWPWPFHRRNNTNKPCLLTTTQTPVDDQTITNVPEEKEEDEDYDEDNKRWPWYPHRRNHTRRPWWPWIRITTRRPWWPWIKTTTEPPRNDSDDDDSSDEHWHPHKRNHTRRPWWPWRSTTIITPVISTSPAEPTSPAKPTSTSKPSETSTLPPATPTLTSTPSETPTLPPATPTTIATTTDHVISSSKKEIITRATTVTRAPPLPPRWSCPDFPRPEIALETGPNEYANVLWHEVARIQTPGVEVPLTFIKCSTVYVHVATVGEYFIPKGAKITYNWIGARGGNQSVTLDLLATRYGSQWLELNEKNERNQLIFVARSGDFLLSYECFPGDVRTDGYIIRILSLDQQDGDDDLQPKVSPLLDLVDSLGLNPGSFNLKPIIQTDC